MNTLYVLIGTLGLLSVLLFFGFIALLWGLRQLLIIGQQNDHIIALLQQISVHIWTDAQTQTWLKEDRGESAPALKWELERRRQIEAHHSSEPRLAERAKAVG